MIRAAAVFVAGIGTVVYLAVLYALTWFHCFGTDAICPAGWMPRTIAAAVYLAAVTVLIAGTRHLLRKPADS